MNEREDRLYDLLPDVYRLRDAEKGYPLRALLRVVAEQVNVVEDDIAQLYENWFIETCQDWVVPYLGDLVGYEPVHEAGEPAAPLTARAQARNAILIPRREVAKTIGNRRRKGTLSLLEVLADAVAGWPARAVEFYRLLSVTQALNFLQRERGRTVDLRDGDALDRLDGPFDELAHTVDVRRIISPFTPQGRHNIPSVGVFVWRLKPYTVTRAPAYCVEEVAPHLYTFSVLGNDAPLFNRARPEPAPTHIAAEENLPFSIRRHAFERDPARFYGDHKSLQIWIGVREGNRIDRETVKPDQIVAANLSEWQYKPHRDQVAVDPVLGRIAFPPSQPPAGVWVSYVYGFSADVGGGEYDRLLAQPADWVIPADSLALYFVGEKEDLHSIEDALEQWNDEQRTTHPHAIIEITDSGVYSEQLNIVLAKGQSLQIRAANRTRPVIDLIDRRKNQPDSLTVTSETGGCFTLDGLLVTGRSVHFEGQLDAITIRHCTLVPGWGIGPNCDPKRPAKPSLELYRTRARVHIAHSIIGSIQVYTDEVQYDPLSLHITDSIVDATSIDREALGDVDHTVAHVTLTVERSTVIGQVQVHAIALAENSIFYGVVTVARRQIGCMRFCYVPPGSRTPRRYNCQPDLVEQPIRNRSAWRLLTPEEKASALEPERLRVRPQFNGVRYGRPVYCQLALTCATEIRRGADDEAEMGVFHDLYQPQREGNLRARLTEYTPASVDAGIIFAT